MSYDKEQRKRELEQNNPRHISEEEKQHNALTNEASEVDTAKQKQVEQHENDRQFVDRDELNSNTISPSPVDNAERNSLFDVHDDMKTVDHIPLEELKQEVHDEKNKDHTKDNSSSD